MAAEKAELEDEITDFDDLLPLPDAETIREDTDILLNAFGNYPQDEQPEDTVDFEREIPDIAITLFSVGFKPPRTTFEKCFSIPSLHLCDHLDSFRIISFKAHMRVEIFLSNITHAPLSLRNFRKVGPLLAFIARARRVRIQATVEFRFFRVSLWGISGRQPKECIQGFLSHYPFYPSGDNLLKIRIAKQRFSTSGGGSAILYYRSAPIEFFSKSFPSSFRLQDCRICWKVASPPPFLARECRYCHNPHATHLCYLVKAHPERYPLSSTERAQAPSEADRNSQLTDYLGTHANRMDLFNCFDDESDPSFATFSAPESLDALKESLGFSQPCSSSASSSAQAPTLDPVLEAFITLVSPPAPAGSKRKFTSSRQGHQNHNQPHDNESDDPNK